MWRAFCSPSVAVAMDNPPFLKGYYLRPGPPLSTPHGAKSGATPEPRPRARMAGFRKHPNDRSRSRGDSALAPKGSSLRHRVLDHRERRLLGPGIQPSTPGTTTIEDRIYEKKFK